MWLKRESNKCLLLYILGASILYIKALWSPWMMILVLHINNNHKGGSKPAPRSPSSRVGDLDRWSLHHGWSDSPEIAEHSLIHDETVFTLFLIYIDMAHTGVGQPLFTFQVFVCGGGVTTKINNGSCNRLFIDLNFPKHLWWVLCKNINLTL